MRRLFQLTSVFAAMILFASCSSDSVAPDLERTGNEADVSNSAITKAKSVTDSQILATLDRVRGATDQYHNVSVAEDSGYVQASSFVPQMGYHYLNEGLMDAEIIPTKPEGLVYVDNPAHDSKRRLVAVEYIIPFQIIDQNSRAVLDGKFPGIDGDRWHAEAEIEAWTLHAWVWYPNPEGIFHPHNPRVKS